MGHSSINVSQTYLRGIEIAEWKMICLWFSSKLNSKCVFYTTKSVLTHQLIICLFEDTVNTNFFIVR